MNTEDLERLLVTTLRNKLSSEKTAVSQTSEWIYVDFPRLDAKMPRISVTLASSPSRPAGIGANVDSGSGTFGIFEETTFDIDIWVHRTNKTTGISPKRAGTSLRDWLGDRIVDVLMKERDNLKSSDGILDIEKIGETPFPFDEEKEIFRKTITFRITYIRTY